ncbi:MAG: glutathione S-transferase family protein [Hyphomicrobiaceae bacterium]
MTKLKIWGRRNSINVQKVMWTVAELGLEHERIDAGMTFGVVTEPWFGNLNPNRNVPVLEDDGHVFWESNVIVRYLTAKYAADQLLPSSPVERAKIEMWMDWQQSVVMPGLGPVFLGLIRTPADQRDDAAISRASEHVRKALSILDEQLANHRYVAGDKMTAADIPLGCVAYRWFSLPVEHGEQSNLRRWYQSLTEREPFRTHVMIPLS